MKNSYFCPVHHGDELVSKQLYDAFKARCIPILTSDEIRLPFENIFADYSVAFFQIPLHESDTLPAVNWNDDRKWQKTNEIKYQRFEIYSHH